MNDEIQPIDHGDGVAGTGDRTAAEGVRNFWMAPLNDRRRKWLLPVLRVGTGSVLIGSVASANSRRWVKLTDKSAQALRNHPLMKGSEPGTARALAMDNGKIKEILELVRKPGSSLTNPALLAGAAGIMALFLLEQTKNQIPDRLTAIEKNDDGRRAERDAVLADMIGVELAIGQAMTVREREGRVCDVTWSKVADAPAKIARIQAYALLRLDAVTEKLEQRTETNDLAKAAEEAEFAGREWLPALAHCFQLQEKIDELEVDRVREVSPEQSERRRLALESDRRNRLNLLARTTERLMARMKAATGAVVQIHPAKAQAVVQSSNHISIAIIDFHERLGIEREREDDERGEED